VLKTTGGTTSDCYTWTLQSGDYYPKGRAMYSNNNGTDWSDEAEGSDYVFEIWVGGRRGFYAPGSGGQNTAIRCDIDYYPYYL